MRLGRGNPAYHYLMGNTPLSTPGAEKDLGLHITRLALKDKSMLIAADRLKEKKSVSCYLSSNVSTNWSGAYKLASLLSCRGRVRC